MKASDLLKKTTITPDDDPRSKLDDEEEFDEEEQTEKVEDDETELESEEAEKVREHETFEDEQEEDGEDEEEESAVDSDPLAEDQESEEEPEEEVAPRHTFKKTSEGGPSPRYHNIAGFSAVEQPDDDIQPPVDQPLNRPSETIDQPETMDDLAAEDVEQGPVNVHPTEQLDEETESMDIPNLKSHQLPSSGIYSSHNENNPREFSTFSPPPRRAKSKNLLLQLVILALIGLAVIGGTVYALKKQFKGIGGSTPTPSVQAVLPSPTPSPSAQITIDRSKYTVRILNGTSTTGLAASVSAQLKKLGYQIDKVGNATNSAFEQTQLRAKPGDSDLITVLIGDLEPTLQAASSSSALKASDAADAEVIIGAK